MAATVLPAAPQQWLPLLPSSANADQALQTSSSTPASRRSATPVRVRTPAPEQPSLVLVDVPSVPQTNDVQETKPMELDEKPIHHASHSFHIRTLRQSDIPQVKALHAQTLPVAYPSSFFLQLLLQPTHLCLVATRQRSPDHHAHHHHHTNPHTAAGTLAHHIHHADEEIIGCISGRFNPDSLPSHQAEFSLSHDALGTSYPTIPSASSSTEPADLPPSLYILTLCVAPSDRRSGVASALLRALSERLLPALPAADASPSSSPQARVNLHVQLSNSAAIALYARHSFKEEAIERGYYRSHLLAANRHHAAAFAENAEGPKALTKEDRDAVRMVADIPWPIAA